MFSIGFLFENVLEDNLKELFENNKIKKEVIDDLNSIECDSRIKRMLSTILVNYYSNDSTGNLINVKNTIKSTEDYSDGDVFSIEYDDSSGLSCKGPIEFENQSNLMSDDNRSEQSFEFSKYKSKAIPKGFGKQVFSIIETFEIDKGFGPLLYEIVIEFVSKLNSAIMSDRNVVSSEALNVWENFLYRSDVKHVQLDIIDFEDTDAVERSSIRRRSGGNIEKMYKIYHNKYSPDYKDDDIVQFSAIKHRGENWQSSPLSKAFFKKETPIIDFLKKHDLINI